MNMRGLVLPPLLCLAVLTAVAPLAPAIMIAQNGDERFTGFAINMNSGPKSAVVDVTIERWSTAAERQLLLAILQEERDVYREWPP